ncbi:MAG: PilZ domain-containing protein [Alteraurantiacibacter sp.]
MNSSNNTASTGGALPENRRHDCRKHVDIECEIRVGAKAWRKKKLRDLTPEGFQVEFLDVPGRGTPVYIRFAGIQMLEAEVCWGKADSAGCRFVNPISPYVFDHIVATYG